MKTRKILLFFILFFLLGFFGWFSYQYLYLYKIEETLALQDMDLTKCQRKINMDCVISMKSKIQKANL